MAYQYTGNGKWEVVYDNPSEDRNDRPVQNTGGSYDPPPVLEDSNRESTESFNNAQKEFKEIEDNILQGDVNVIPNPNYRAKLTVKIDFIGKYLSGLYFVDKVTHSFSNSGYAQSLSVSKNGFGDTVKSGSAKKDISSVAPPEKSDPTRPEEVKPTVSSRTYTIQSGDTLWGISTKYYGKGSDYTKILDANKDKISNASLIYPGQVITIP